MKRVFAPVTALVLAATGYSLHAAGWFQPCASPPQAHLQQSSCDTSDSDAAFRHRTCHSHHWRSMLMVK
jgi:hypothetical protein